jgi:tetratricopeptide (TPR) repeat protein
LSDCNRALDLSANGTGAGILESRGLVRLRLGDYDKAIGDYDASLKLNPRNAWPLYGRGLAKIRKNSKTQGEADLAEAARLDPNIAGQFARRGMLP